MPCEAFLLSSFLFLLAVVLYCTPRSFAASSNSSSAYYRFERIDPEEVAAATNIKKRSSLTQAHDTPLGQDGIIRLSWMSDSQAAGEAPKNPNGILTNDGAGAVGDDEFQDSLDRPISREGCGPDDTDGTSRRKYYQAGISELSPLLPRLEYCPFQPRSLFGPNELLPEEDVMKIVEVLADDIIEGYKEREVFLGRRSADLLYMAVNGSELLEEVIKGFDEVRPTMRSFITNISSVLDNIRFITPEINSKFFELHSLDNETYRNLSGLDYPANTTRPPTTATTPTAAVAGRGVTLPVAASQHSRPARRHHHHHHDRTKDHHNTTNTVSSGTRLKRLSDGNSSVYSPTEDSSGSSSVSNVRFKRSALKAQQRREGRLGCKPQSVPYSGRTNLDWWRPMQRALDYARDVKRWYTFLYEFSEAIADPGVQMNRHHNITGDFTGWEGSDTGIDPNNVQEALEKIKQEFALASLTDESIPGLVRTANRTRLYRLNQMVQAGLKERASCEIANGRTWIIGPWVLMEEIIDCWNRSKGYNKYNLTVLATHAIIIDRDFELLTHEYEMYNLTFIAPRWHILKPSLVLNISGEKGPPSEGDPDYVAGRPGNPGYNGGSFFGIVEEVVGAEADSSWTIVSNGGEGGDGMDGNYKPVDIVCDDPRESAMLWCCVTYEPQWHYVGKDGGQAGLGGRPGVVDIFSTKGDTFPSLDDDSDGSATASVLRIQQLVGVNGSVGKGQEQKLTMEKPSKEEYTKAGIIRNGDYYCKHDKPRMVPDPAKEPQWNGVDGNDSRAASDPLPLNFELNFYAVEPIRRFKAFTFREFSHHIFSLPVIINLTEAIDNNVTLNLVHRTLDLVLEVAQLEMASMSLLEMNRTDELFFQFKSLFVRADRLLNVTSTSEDERRVLAFLGQVLRTLKLLRTSPYEPLLVVDIDEFLKDEQKMVAKLKAAAEEQLQYQYIKQLEDDYHGKIRDHFVEAMTFIDKVIWPEIDAAEKKLYEITDFLLVTLEELLQKEYDNLEAIADQRKRMNIYYSLFSIMDGIKFAGYSLNFLPPPATVMSEGGTFLSSIFNTRKPIYPTKPYVIPDAVKFGAQNAAIRFRNYSGSTLDTFTTMMNVTAGFLNNASEEFAVPLQTIEWYLGNVTLIKNLTEGINTTYAAQDCFDSFLHLLYVRAWMKECFLNLTKEIEEAIDAASGSTRIAFGTVATAGGYALDVIKAGWAIYKWIQDNKQALREVVFQYSQVKGYISKTEDAINRVETEMITQITSAFFEISDLTSDLQGLSVIQLDVVRWRVQTVLRDTRTDLLKEFTQGTQVDAYVERALEKVEEAMTTMINIYQRIEQYKEQGEIVRFTANVNQNPDYFFGRLEDPALNDAVESLRFQLQGGVISKRFTLAASTYRMWRFPMVDPALCLLESLAPPSLNLTTREAILKFLTDSDERLEAMLSYTTRCKNAVCPGDNYVLDAPFTHEPPYKPFFIWRNASYSFQINALLEGRLVHMTANVLEGNKKCDAIKFRMIILYFTPAGGKNESLETGVQMALQDFEVSMTHQGNNYFLFNNQVYSFTGAPVELYFGFKLGPDKIPVAKNNPYKKLLVGDLTLSPFATWAIKIQPVNAGMSFDVLKPFQNLMDVHLEGQGVCIRLEYGREVPHQRPDCSGLL